MEGVCRCISLFILRFLKAMQCHTYSVSPSELPQANFPQYANDAYRIGSFEHYVSLEVPLEFCYICRSRKGHPRFYLLLTWLLQHALFLSQQAIHPKTATYLTHTKWSEHIAPIRAALHCLPASFRTDFFFFKASSESCLHLWSANSDQPDRWLRR